MVMKTIILSDMALLGSDVEDTRDGIKRLNYLQHQGFNIVMLSNRPEYCMRKIGGSVNDKGEVSYQYLGNCDVRGEGVSVVLFRPNIETLYTLPIKADYTIFGNGICTFDSEDELISMREFIKKSDLNKMISVFEENGYASIESRLKSMDRFGDRCIAQGEDIYKFFVPENGVSKPSNRVYGMQCSGRDEEQDAEIIARVEENVSGIRGYRLNGKPCFYQKSADKLHALHQLLDHEDIKVDDCLMILSELTDDVILDMYPYKSEVVKGELKPNSPKTLAKVLKEVM